LDSPTAKDYVKEFHDIVGSPAHSQKTKLLFIIIFVYSKLTIILLKCTKIRKLLA